MARQRGEADGRGQGEANGQGQGIEAGEPRPEVTVGPEVTVELEQEEPCRASVWLVFEEPTRVQCFPLAPGQEATVGSGPAADVRLDDRAVSARHCRVVHAGPALEVVDLGSRNGVHVGGARVARASLVVGAAFEIGCTRIRVEPAVPPAASADAPLPALVGESQAMRRLAGCVRRVAQLRLPVLLRGESGTGKDLVAQAIHTESRRASRPFVVINAATISRELGASELFGHQRGAFTGAVRDRRGAFREAHHGTLFLDEIASLPLDVQAKLLRVVEEGQVRPLGTEASAPIDVRLIAATCEPLEQMVAARQFRADLYERLAVCVVNVPALRERPEDIPALARHLLVASDLGDRELTRGALALLRAQRFPGNVRELRNVVVQAAVHGERRVTAEDVAAALAAREGATRQRVAPGEALRIYEETGGNVSAAARRAGLPRSTMRDLLRTAARRAKPR
jgi:MoxR-like ATPase